MKKPLEKAIDVIVKVAHPDKIILFGSRGRGDNVEQSDYDLLVLKEGVKNSRALAQKIYLNFRNIGAPVDVIVADSNKFDQLKKNPYYVYNEAVRHGRVVYEGS